jgi:hypothetical protein
MEVVHMKKFYPLSIVLVFVLAICFSVISGCSSDSDGLSAPAANISGTWDAVEITIADTCEDPLSPPLNETVTMVQADGSNTVTATFDDGTPVDTSDDTTIDMTLSGSSLTYSGTVTDVDGSASVTVNLTVDVSATPYTFSGAITWVWTEAGTGATCTGNSTYTGIMR